MTRLLKTPIKPTSNDAAIANAPRYRLISVHLPFAVARHCPGSNAEIGLLVEPDVLEAPAVEDAVDHHPQTLDSRLPAGGEPQVIDDRPRLVLLQSSVDLPHQPLALLLVALHRLLLEHFLQLGIAIPGVVPLRAAGVILIELRIGVVDADPGEIEANLVILAVDFGKPIGRLDRVELAVDVDLLQLVDQDDRRIPEYRDVPLRHLDREPFLGPIAEPIHDAAGLGAVLLYIGTVAGQGLEHGRRHSPHPLRRRLHGSADVAMPFGEDVDKRLAVQAQRQRPPHFGIVERQGIAIDDQIGAGVRRYELADRLWRLALDVPQ